MIGQQLSRYRILDRLGEGGMGVVYRARDERLDRDVALKVLPAGALADPPAQARFRTEAIALSRLSHPAIATVFDFDRDRDTDFLVMEYVPGTTLAERIASGSLSLGDVAGLGAQIADALAAAHEQGVVHRDLKPGNVMVTPRGQIKVLDFGLAKLRDRAGDVSADEAPTALMTAPQMVIGTPAYMAPEQLLGRTVDARSDCYALGVMLYEMATGRRPFDQSPFTALLDAALHSAPAPPRTWRAELPARLETLILRALEKAPERRPGSAAEMAVELRALISAVHEAPRTPRPRIESLAVLPLENLSGDPAQEFFADGMTETLIGGLARIGALRVISRTSVMQYKGARRSLPEIARALNVDAIVEGAVIRSGNRVRISAQLIDAASDRHLWANSYERDAGDVLALQSEVAQAVAKEIQIHLTPEERARLAEPRPVDPRAFEAYLRGRFLWNRRTPTEVRQSLEFFRQAIEFDPGYARGHAGLGDAYNILGDLNALPPDEAFAHARAAATRAVELDPDLAEAHTSLGFVRYFFEWDWEGAEIAFRRALECNPSYATGHQWYAEYLISQGRFAEAEAEARRARELDPLAFIIRTSLADVFYFSRRYDEAIRELRETIAEAPTFVPAHSDLARALSQRGDHDEAIAMFLRVMELNRADPDLSPGLGYTYARAGRVDDARRVLARTEAMIGKTLHSPHAIGVIYVALGEHETAFQWLDRAFREHDRGFVWAKVHPRLDPLRDDPRFRDILRRMRLAS